MPRCGYFRVGVRLLDGGGAWTDSPVAGIVWATSKDSDNLVRIDPRTRTATHIGHMLGFPTELAVGRGSVWVSDWKSATVRRIDTRTRKVVAVIPVGTDPESITVAYGNVWVHAKPHLLFRIDPKVMAAT